MTGPDAPFGDKFKKAYSMAVEEINAAGGINGKRIEVIIEDHQAKNALELAHRGYVLESGRVALEGAGPDLLANRRVREAYLGL